MNVVSKDVEIADKVIRDNAPVFKIMQNFHQIIEDVAGFLDQKQDQIDTVYHNFATVEKDYQKTIKKQYTVNDIKK